MSPVATPGDDGSAQRSPRRYDSPVRRQQAADTHERILTAAGDLVRGLPRWDWQSLTFRAIAERAGVSERTVYRYFATERELQDAVMSRLEEDAGVSYEGLELGDLADVSSRVFASLSSYAIDRWGVEAPQNPTLVAEDVRRRDAVVAAVERVTAGWTESQRRMAGGILDVLWNPPTYERLVVNWGLDTQRATDAITWAIGVLVGAVEAGDRPPGGDGA
jgi:AcrR family transcriptional regulator